MKRVRSLYRRLRRRPYIKFGRGRENLRLVHGKAGEPISFFAEGDSVTPTTWLTDAVGSDPHPRPAASAESQSHDSETTGGELGKLIGYLVAFLDEPRHPVILIPPHECQRDALKGKAAKAAGIPGSNGHERSAYNVALYLKNTMRMAGRR